MDEREWIRFAENVREMRRAQTRYFAARRSADLIYAKRIEETIDVTLNRIFNPRLPLDDQGDGR